MNLILLAADLVAISVLLLAFYLPRRGRRELVSSFLVINVGVLAVATALSNGTIEAGLGLGLFGVLSIIRLRSEELTHREIAYYFASLSLGLLGGTGGIPDVCGLGLMAVELAAVAIGDHPRVSDHTAGADLILDRVVTAPEVLMARAAELVDGQIAELSVVRVDTVNDTTTVRVRFCPTRAALPPGHTTDKPVGRRSDRGLAR